MDRSPPQWNMCTRSPSSRKRFNNPCNRIATARSCLSLGLMVRPIVAKTFSLVEAAEALRYLVEGRPFGRVVLTVCRQSIGGKQNNHPALQLANTSCQINPTTRGRAYSERNQ